MLRISATVAEHKNCPLYSKGDTLEFSPPAVEGMNQVPVCATAVESLNKVVPRIQGGLGPVAFDRTFCGGCSGKAWFNFAAAAAPAPAPVPPGFSQLIMSAFSKMKIFSGVSETRLQKILPLFHGERSGEGEVLLRQGEPAKGLYVILIGECDVVRTDEGGSESVLATLHPGECFGEISLITGETTSASVRAKTPVALVSISKENFPRVLAQMPSLSLSLARVLAARLANTSAKILEELKKGMVGKLEAVPPADLVQAMNVNGQSGMLMVQHGSKSGVIYFHEGQVHQVELGDVKGEEAFYEFLTWARGNFRWEPGRKESTTRQVRLDTMGLLLEGMRRVDEYKQTGVWKKEAGPSPA